MTRVKYSYFVAETRGVGGGGALSCKEMEDDRKKKNIRLERLHQVPSQKYPLQCAAISLS